MWTNATHATKDVTDYQFRRLIVDLGHEHIQQEVVPCHDLDDFLGGMGRAFRVLEHYDVEDAYAPDAPLVMNLGAFSGTPLMTGLRVFFSAYSPLKVANNGKPFAMWATASGKFATKVLAATIDEVIFLGRATRPVLLLIRNTNDAGLSLSLEDARSISGLTTHDKILSLTDRYRNAHVAVIGPAGEQWQQNRYASIACSTVNQIHSRECKPRFAGRGGMGSIMGSKNLIAIVAQAPDRTRGKLSPALLAANKEISRGPGSANYRDARKGGNGGTWRNVAGLHPVGALPEKNFWPQGTEQPVPLYRDSMEDAYCIKDESCFQCGIACHKNIYSVREENGRRKPGKFYTKFDYEPLNLLTVNLGIYDPEQSLELVELVDQVGFDAISLGVTLGYIMDYNARHPEQPIVGGLSFGDFAATRHVIVQAAAGGVPEIGRGVKRLSEQLGEPAYAMHCKGLELPAYLPETNPGYPFAIAGGHMGMRTFLLLVTEGKTDLDYWVDAIVRRGIYYTRDDVIGLCKFAGTPDEIIEPVFQDLYGVTVTREDMQHTTQRAYLRGLLLERKQGATLDDYVLPARVYEQNPHVQLPHFLTPDFWDQLRARVLQAFDEQIVSYGLRPAA